MFACIHAVGRTEKLLECGQSFSPVVEQTSPDTIVFDASGLDRLYGQPHDLAAAIAKRAESAGLEARVALASNPDAAICAARGFSGVHVIPYGDEGKYLASLPLALLSPDPAVFETLERWGIRTFRDLAALPEVGIAERLGTDGVKLRKLSAGTHIRPLRMAEEPLQFAGSLDLEYPVALLEPLSFLIARLLNDLCAKLSERGCATTELRLALTLENRAKHARTLKLPVPMCNARTFLKLIQLDLDEHPPSAPVIGIALEIEPVKPRVAQEGLFVPIAPEPEKLELTLARISALVGEGNAGTPALLDTHRPDAFRMDRFVAEARSTPARKTTSAISPRDGSILRNGRAAGIAQFGSGDAPDVPRLALRRFRPPVPASVLAPSGRLEQVSSPAARGKVLEFAGPWRTSGDWWSFEAWSSDEWDVALADGGLYRISCERATGRWFVEGSYD